MSTSYLLFFEALAVFANGRYVGTADNELQAVRRYGNNISTCPVSELIINDVTGEFERRTA